MATFAAGEKITAARLNLIADPPLLVAQQIVVQTLANITWAAITMTGETIDSLNGHSTSTNPSRYTPSTAGYYEVEGQVAFAASTAGDRGAQIRKNGATIDGAHYGAQRAMAGVGSFSGIARCGAVVFLNGTTDYIELYGYQDSGGNLNTYYTAGFTASYMKVKRISG